MDSDILWLIIGGLGFLFRAWAVEIKLEPELEYRRHYIDRFLSYYAFLAIMGEFQSVIFNYLVIFTSPGAILGFIALDIPFFIKFSKRTYWKDHFKILWFERITLHLPGIIIGILLIIRELKSPLLSENFILEGIAALILVLTPLFIMDHRIKYNEAKPQRILIVLILILEVLSLIGYAIYRGEVST